MSKTRLEAFSDGVMAILITIMVLELKIPHGDSIRALAPVAPAFLTYVLSYVFLGIYWNNHHHMLHATERINGNILWANLHLLFWLSLVPFVTGWMGENHFAATPTALYGGILLAAGIAYVVLAEVSAFDLAARRVLLSDGRALRYDLLLAVVHRGGQLVPGLAPAAIRKAAMLPGTWFVHIFFLIGFRNRVLVILEWAWQHLTFRRGARLITDTAAQWKLVAADRAAAGGSDGARWAGTAGERERPGADATAAPEQPGAHH